MVDPQEAPILEFDPAVEAVIEPSAIASPEDVPTNVVICFFHEVIERVVATHPSSQRFFFTGEHGSRQAFWEIEWERRRLGLFHPGVGAPLAVGLLEQAIAKGCRSFVACGGAGAVVPALTMGHLVVPTSAIRDEGTSYHYLPPGRSVSPSASAVEAITATLEANGVPFVTGPTWTTDAPYRETRGRMKRRTDEGCLTVEMGGCRFLRRRRLPRDHLWPDPLRRG